ncbi:MAG TPA: hypothetical protein VLK84_08300, partial [Longimicrobium sp.]|nr:hypothetical protein [Longimicrobium sp.]
DAAEPGIKTTQRGFAMSEFAFYLAPSDPYCLPDEEGRAKFLALFKTVSPLPNGNGDYDYRVYDRPTPVDAGAGFEALVCPQCSERLVLFDGDGDTPHKVWWDSVLAGPRDATVVLPCCGGSARLVDIRFHAPGGFARFAVGALEPSFSEFWVDGGDHFGCLTDETLKRFEEIIGCPVLQIWEV